MATIYIDNKPYEVEEGRDLLRTCLSLGFDIPYFCWHPALHSVGACRQCAVKQFRDENDTKGKIVMSCMTPAADGTRISIDDPEVKAFRASVIEWLMLNHPHNCPVCDEGGECHLQDMTVLAGHAYRRTRFRKRTHRNQYLGPFINHEMNRCIQCYRCVRFYRDYAGGRDLEVFGSRDHVYFGRSRDGVLESGFSGNLVEVCPTGVFTDKTLKRHYTRKWDLQTAPSICVHCGLGCNTIPGERYGILRRVLNRYNHEVNGYFLCDRGRFGYEFVNSDRRLREPLLMTSSGDEQAGSFQRPVNPKEALQRVSNLLHFGADVIGIGSPRASLEANYLLRKLVGPQHFYSGVSEKESVLLSLIIEVLTKGRVPSASLLDVRQSDAVFILGEDIGHSAPMLELAVRQAIRNKSVETAGLLHIPEWHDAAVRTAAGNKNGPLFVATVDNTGLDDKASVAFRGADDDIARLGFAVAHELDKKAPVVQDLDEGMRSQAQVIAESLREAERPLIVSGTGCGSAAVIRAAAAIAEALCEIGSNSAISFAVPECNSLGLALICDRSLEDAFLAVEEGASEAVIVLENDLLRRGHKDSVANFMSKAGHVVALDHIQTATTERANIVLPVATFAETTGTLVNSEGRCQRFFQVFTPSEGIRSGSRWLTDIMNAVGRGDEMKDLDEVLNAISEELPVFGRIRDAAPPAGLRINGQKVPRQPHRYSGRTAMHADISVHEPQPPEDLDSPLSFSMEGYTGRPPSPLIPRFWAPHWNSVQAVTKFQKEAGGQLYGGDPGVRLFEPAGGTQYSSASVPPEAFRPRKGEVLIAPLHHIFGSEELSSLSTGIAELAALPYLALGTDVAAGLGVEEGEEIGLTLSGTLHRLPVKIRPALSPGMGGLPYGLNGLPGIVLPAWGRVSKIGGAA